MLRLALVVIALLIANALPAAVPARPPAVAPAPSAPSGAGFSSPEALLHYARARLSEERGDDSEALAEYLRALSTDSRSLSATRVRRPRPRAGS